MPPAAKHGNGALCARLCKAGPKGSLPCGTMHSRTCLEAAAGAGAPPTRHKAHVVMGRAAQARCGIPPQQGRQPLLPQQNAGAGGIMFILGIQGVCSRQGAGAASRWPYALLAAASNLKESLRKQWPLRLSWSLAMIAAQAMVAARAMTTAQVKVSAQAMVAAQAESHCGGPVGGDGAQQQAQGGDDNRPGQTGRDRWGGQSVRMSRRQGKGPGRPATAGY